MGEPLDHRECLRLLGTVAVGRLAVTEQGLVLAHPVAYRVVDNNAIVFATSATGHVASVTHNKVVGFEADHFDTDLQRGWSVMVIGYAHHVRDTDELQRLNTLQLHTWAPHKHSIIVRIEPEMIDGRRLHLQPGTEGLVLE